MKSRSWFIAIRGACLCEPSRKVKTHASLDTNRERWRLFEPRSVLACIVHVAAQLGRQTAGSRTCVREDRLPEIKSAASGRKSTMSRCRRILEISAAPQRAGASVASHCVGIRCKRCAPVGGPPCDLREAARSAWRPANLLNFHAFSQMLQHHDPRVAASNLAAATRTFHVPDAGRFGVVLSCDCVGTRDLTS